MDLILEYAGWKLVFAGLKPELITLALQYLLERGRERGKSELD